MKMRMTKRQADIYRRRLLKLAAFLRTLPAKRFNFGHWVGEDWRGDDDLSCGTTACALGWATTIPAFRRLGLRMEREGCDHPVCQGEEWENVAGPIFGLNTIEARWLFVSREDDEDSHYDRWGGSQTKRLPRTATAKLVAKYIEQFVKSWKPEKQEESSPLPFSYPSDH
jgi:hypothetical protein